MKEITKTVDNPGFGDKQMNKQAFVKRWTNWAKDFLKLADIHEYAKFQERVKALAEKKLAEIEKSGVGDRHTQLRLIEEARLAMEDSAKRIKEFEARRDDRSKFELEIRKERSEIEKDKTELMNVI